MRNPFFVTASHAVGPYDQQVPYGMRHARQPGNQTTECGIWALNWPLFWESPFEEGDAAVCTTCLQNTALAREVATFGMDAPIGVGSE